MNNTNSRYKIRRIRFKKFNEQGTNIFSTDKLSDKQKRKMYITLDDSDLARSIIATAPEDCHTDQGGNTYLDNLVLLKVDAPSQYLNLIDYDGTLLLDGVPYKRFLCAAGHSRAHKVFFASAKVWDRMMEFALCGIGPTSRFVLSKYNAYHGLMATGSTPVTMPRFVVVPEHSVSVPGVYDYVRDGYKVERGIRGDVSIKPFDGGAIVDVSLAEEWQRDLGKSYLPSAFQFRCIPGIKGVGFTFPIKEFASEHKVRYIKDIWGRTWDIVNDGVNMIMSESCFKFHALYRSWREWYEKFKYSPIQLDRTFNIARVADDPNTLHRESRIAYQATQTVPMYDEEIERLCQRTVEKIKRLHCDMEAFLDYRGVKQYDECGNPDPEWERIPAFYKAMRENPSLACDDYVWKKICQDLNKMVLSSKLGRIVVEGNYEILCPDIYGLAQHAFGLPVTGLLGANEIYSAYWNRKGKGRVSMIRFPHVGLEHSIMSVTTTQEMERWYGHQTSTIVTGFKDTAVLRAGGADFDGDTVLTTCSPELIGAIERLDIHTIVSTKHQPDPELHPINDIKELMKADYNAFGCDIGSVVNPTSNLWNYEPDEKTADYITVLSVIDGEVIDAPKTGVVPEIPKEIRNASRRDALPYFLRYRELLNGAKVSQLGRYSDAYPSTANKICWQLEKELDGVDTQKPGGEFQWATLLTQEPPIRGPYYNNLRERLLKLRREFKMLCADTREYHDKDAARKEMESFFDQARTEFLLICKNVDKCLDYLIYILYADGQLCAEDNKDFLWSCFPEEMIQRATGQRTTLPEANVLALQERSMKSRRNARKRNKRARDAGVLPDGPVIVGANTVDYINNINGDANQKKLLLTLDILTRPGENCNSTERRPVLLQRYGQSNISKSRFAQISAIDRRVLDDVLRQAVEERRVEIEMLETVWSIIPRIPILDSADGVELKNVTQIAKYIERNIAL